MFMHNFRVEDEEDSDGIHTMTAYISDVLGMEVKCGEAQLSYNGDADADTTDGYYLDFIRILPEWQHQGWGRMFMNHIVLTYGNEDISLEVGQIYGYPAPDFHRLVTFYESFGFEVDEDYSSTMLRYGGAPDELYWLKNRASVDQYSNQSA